jgi:hypothetical protein
MEAHARAAKSAQNDRSKEYHKQHAKMHKKMLKEDLKLMKGKGGS